MAVYDAVSHARPSILAPFSSVLRDLRDAYARHVIYAQTVAELSAMTLRELDDIGVRPSDIKRVAREAAAAK